MVFLHLYVLPVLQLLSVSILFPSKYEQLI